MFTKSRVFEFDYGHRVHGNKTCQHFHGHSGKIIVTFQAENLKRKEVLIDFENLKWFQDFLVKRFNHKFLIDISDPLLFSNLSKIINFTGEQSEHIELFTSENTALNILSFEEGEAENEIGDSFVFCNFNPTAEKLAQLFFEMIQDTTIKFGIVLQSVTFIESKNNECKYINPAL